mmetsp:Transcript_16505/g.18663  ORF Transcript_16505/g.18663 Transcript_16505/m.18663 type:complete len:97 (+) Transcript_16505:233-523(+)
MYAATPYFPGYGTLAYECPLYYPSPSLYSTKFEASRANSGYDNYWRVYTFHDKESKSLAPKNRKRRDLRSRMRTKVNKMFKRSRTSQKVMNGSPLL